MNKEILETEYSKCLERWLEGRGIDYSLSMSDASELYDARLLMKQCACEFVVMYCRDVYPQKIVKLMSLYKEPFLIVAGKASEHTFEFCRKKGVNLMSLDGNAYLNEKSLFIDIYRQIKGKAKSTSGTVFTPKSTRVVRALLANPRRSFSQKEFIKETGLSQSQVSKAVTQLTYERYVFTMGGISKLSEGESLLQDWLAHYRMDRHKKVHYALSAKNYDEGLRKLSSIFLKADVRYGFTGMSGAYLRAPYGNSDTYMAYVESAEDLKKIKGIYPVASGGNVQLWIPQDEGVLQFSKVRDDLWTVSDIQLYLDLSRLPGRAKDQAEHLKNELIRFGAM